MIKIYKLYKSKLKEQQEEEFVASNKTLTKAELAKVRGDKVRLEIFIELIKNGATFILTDGRKVIVDKDYIEKRNPPLDKDLKNTTFVEKLKKLLDSNQIDDDSVANRIFSTKRGIIPVPIKSSGGQVELVPLNKFRKLKELGGEPAASREAQQRIAMGELADLIEQAKQESNADSITIKIYGYKDSEPEFIYNVDGVIDLKEKESGVSPTNDFVLTTKNEDRKRYYISHKAGSTPKDCQQYSGVTNKAGSNIAEDEEVLDFIKYLLANPKLYSADGSFKEGTAESRVIKNPLLMRWAIFGQGYGGKSSINNVDALIQGKFILTRVSSGVYNLSASHILLRKSYEENNETDFGEGYEPTLMARRGDRNLVIRFENEQKVKKIYNIRIFIGAKEGRISSAFLKERRKK